jgi:hypothetical protein
VREIKKREIWFGEPLKIDGAFALHSNKKYFSTLKVPQKFQ